MVNFNNETTVTTAPRDIIKIIILERRKYVIDAIEDHYKTVGRGLTPDKSVLHGRLMGLFYEVEPMHKRSMSETEYQELKDKLFTKLQESHIEVFNRINNLMDKKGITKIDTRKDYDRTDAEAENEAFGL